MQKITPWIAASIVCGGLCITACSKDKAPPPPPTPSTAPLSRATRQVPPPSSAQLPPGHPPVEGIPTATGTPPDDAIHGGIAKMPEMPPPPDDRPLLDKPVTQFAGIELTPPKEWGAFDANTGPMAPVAAFVLKRADGDTVDATARLTHFPGMKNIPLESQIARWYGQVQQPDGSSTEDSAKQETIEAGDAKITVVEMTGSIGGAENQRMIVAVIEHPQGPHFLKVVGPDKTVAKWRDSVIEYLKSAKVTP